MASPVIAADVDLNYWARTEPGTNAEVDFVLVEAGQLVPIEVKAGMKGSLKSLHYLLTTYPHIPSATVFGRFREGVEGKIHFRPIYKAGGFRR